MNRVLAVAEALAGKGQVLVDSLAGYTLAEATRVGRTLDDIENLGWWEDVLMPEDYGAYAILAERMDVPICAGEQYSNRFSVPGPLRASRLRHRQSGHIEDRHHRDETHRDHGRRLQHPLLAAFLHGLGPVPGVRNPSVRGDPELCDP